MDSNSFDTLAHQLLADLDLRHDALLNELDALNARVDAVLSQYTQVAPDVAPSPSMDAASDDDDELSDE